MSCGILPRRNLPVSNFRSGGSRIPPRDTRRQSAGAEDSMDFELTEDQKTTQKWLHEFAEKEIRPVAAEYDESEDFPWPVLKKAAEIGIYSLDFYTSVASE